MRVGIQGQPGSACDEAASFLVSATENSFEYLTDAKQTLAALASDHIDKAVLALESPLGVAIPETTEALALYPSLAVVDELRQEVRHCILVHPSYADGTIRQVASHAIPLKKHRDFLEQRFPGYKEVVLSDPGVAAQQLSEGQLPADTAVIAMPRAVELFGLKILEKQLPANDNYLTRFVVMAKVK